MKRCCFLLLMICLTCEAGLPLFARGNADRFMTERQSTRELQNIRESQNAEEAQNPVAQQNPEGLLPQDTEGFQNRERPEHWPEQTQDTVGIQSREEFQNNKELQDTTRLQNRQEPQNREEPQDKTKIKLTGNRLIIEDLPEDGVLEIYNIMGVKVFNRRVKAGTNQYILSLPKGYYIIKIGKFTRKIAIK